MGTLVELVVGRKCGAGENSQSKATTTTRIPTNPNVHVATPAATSRAELSQPEHPAVSYPLGRVALITPALRLGPIKFVPQFNVELIKSAIHFRVVEAAMVGEVL